MTVADTFKNEIANAMQSVKPDPVTFVSQAPAMLQEARSRLIKLQAEYHARREHQLVKMHEQLLQMDQEHDKLVENLQRIIAKLEALRA